MRFAITANDRYQGVFEAFINAGWKPLKLFTIPARSEFGNQQAVIDLAGQHNAAIQLSRMTEHDMQELREQGCDALIVASYDWHHRRLESLPQICRQFSLLPFPDGRGSYPVVRAILENRNSWGIDMPSADSHKSMGEKSSPSKISAAAQ